MIVRGVRDEMNRRSKATSLQKTEGKEEAKVQYL
jgi:hypothetical protein